MAVIIRPQPGPQEKALGCNADIILLGGAKGGGKSYAMRLAPIPHLSVRGFHAVIFRCSRPQLTRPGGQWDKSYDLYPYLGGSDQKTDLRWTFPAGSSVTFAHLLDDNDWLDWQGTETAMFLFDQLEEFTKTQFLKILGCSRSTCGVRTQLWGTMNPDCDSWVRELVDPWIAEDGYVDLEQDGRVKHLTIVDDQITWVDADWRDSNDRPAKSIVYFTADIWDNPALLNSDPDYLSNLQSQSLVDRERFLGVKGRGGNWNIRPVAGKVFKSDWFIKVPTPGNIIKLVRYWDFASSEKENKGDDPDFTASVKMGLLASGGCVILDTTSDLLTPGEVERKLREVTIQDGRECLQRWQRDPGQAGVYQDSKLMSLLRGFDAIGIPSQLSKYERAKPLSRAAEFGQILMLESTWNQAFINELTQYPDGDHDDYVDAAAGAYNCLNGAASLGSSSTGNYAS